MDLLLRAICVAAGVAPVLCPFDIGTSGRRFRRVIAALIPKRSDSLRVDEVEFVPSQDAGSR
jgi:hypothetical protein